MSILLIHITDAHTVVGDALVSRRGHAIATAALSEVMELEEIHIIFTGDTVQSGKAEEYLVFESFLKDLMEELSSARSVPIKVLNVAGNHDCDFAEDQSLRDMLLKSALQSQSNITSQIAKVLSQPQDNFRSYADRWSTNEFADLSVSCSTFRVEGSTSIRYVLLNSALFSRKSEAQGGLFISLPNKDAIPSDSDKVVFLMHHPLGWLVPDNARELAQWHLP